MKDIHSLSKKAVSWILLLCSFVYILLVYIPNPANACSCAPPPSVESEFSRSDAVFSGKVISVKDKRSLNGILTKSVIFEVSQTWKGVKESQINITTGSGGGDCGIHFIVGEEYLVYSRESDMYGKKQLTTIMCDRTVDLASATEDLKYLGEGKPPTKQVNIASEDLSRITLISIFSILGFGLIVIIIFRKWKKS